MRSQSEISRPTIYRDGKEVQFSSHEEENDETTCLLRVEELLENNPGLMQYQIVDLLGYDHKKRSTPVNALGFLKARGRVEQVKGLYYHCSNVPEKSEEELN